MQLPLIAKQAGLFSAVASAFIVDVQTQIRPDYDEMSFTVLVMLLNATSGIPNQAAIPTAGKPNPAMVEVQAILCSSLASALLAAFLAMLGKQWLNLHVEGSFIDRNRHRELRMRGMIAWRFKFVMECLPLVMQGSLLLLGYALARYFWDVSRTVSSVVIAFTVFGVVFYLFIVSAGTVSKTCPFQTPISIVLRAIREYYREDITEALKTIQHFFTFKGKCGGVVTHCRRIPVASYADEQKREVRADSSCILTMFKITKSPESMVAVMAYIPEITWDARLRSVPLLQVYQTLRGSLWRSADGRILPRPESRETAFASGKALLHLYIQRRCIYGVDDSLTSQVELMDHARQPLGHDNFDGDFDLQSVFYIIDWTFGVEPEIPWSEFDLSDSHHGWLSHILQYRAWDSLQTHGKLAGDVEGFVRYSFTRKTLPSNQVIANCLFVISMVISAAVGRHPPAEELLVKDRRSVFSSCSSCSGLITPQPRIYQAYQRDIRAARRELQAKYTFWRHHLRFRSTVPCGSTT
jgi:hypothetical protein